MTRPTRSRRWSRAPLCMLALLLGACAVPFSEMQSARLTGPGRLEVVPNYSHIGLTGFKDERFSRIQQMQAGLQAATGLSDDVDLRLRYEGITLSEASSWVHMLALGAKLPLVRDQLALYLPVGFAFGSDIVIHRTWLTQPTLIATFALTDYLELNTSTKTVLPLRDPFDDLNMGVNVGLGISPEPEVWSIRPEAGMLYYFGGTGVAWQAAIGVAYYWDFAGK